MTSRTLVIMRHAKAERPDSSPDVKRPLMARGRDDARAGGLWLAEHKYAPDVVLCSSATRTRGTWHEVAIGLVDGGVTTAPTVHYEDDLYSGGVNSALDLIRALPDDATTVLLVGHNPTVSALSIRLDDGAKRAEAGLRTAGIAVHNVKTPWSDVAAAKLAHTETPRA